MLDLHPREQLCLMLKQYGQTIIFEPKRCKGLLSDLAPQHRLEIHVLIVALEQKVAEDLLKATAFMPIDMQIKRLAQSLRDATGIEEQLAYWAVESWALALCVIQQPLPKVTNQPELDESPDLLLIPVITVKKIPRTVFVVFFISLLVGSIVIATAFALRPARMTKPPPVQIRINKIEEIAESDTNSEHYDAWSQNNLGDLYYYGDSVDVDYQKAADWYRKAAEQGNAVGQCNLGFMYTNGYGAPKDYEKAADWYRKAAEQGNADGQNNLATMYENGYGVAKDNQQAEQWYRKAVEQGHYGAQESLRTLRGK